MARIAGINVSDRKHVWVCRSPRSSGSGARGRSQYARRRGVDPNVAVKDLAEPELEKIRAEMGAVHHRRGSAPRGGHEHQATHGPWLLPRAAPSPRPSRARAAHAHERAYPQGSAPPHPQVTEHGNPTQGTYPQARPTRHRGRRRAHPCVVQQHHHHDHGPTGQRPRLGHGGGERGFAARARVPRSPRRWPPAGSGTWSRSSGCRTWTFGSRGRDRAESRRFVLCTAAGSGS